MFYHALTGNGGATPTENLEPVLLWTNSNPTARFDAQTISLNLTDYAGVIIEFYAEDDKQTLAARSYLKKDDIINGSNFGTGHTDATSSAASRNYTINNDGVTFSSGYFSNSTTTEVLIPYKIYGVKSYVVEPVNNLQLITTSQDKTVTFTAEDNVNYLVIESACNTTGAVGIHDCSVDNGELEVLKHLVEAKLETYTALIKNAVGTVNYSSASTSDFEMILIFKLVG